jgi:hypothetical protein
MSTQLPPLDARYMGTEMMVRQLLRSRLFVSEEEAKRRNVNWLVGMAVIIRLVVDQTVQAKQPKGIWVQVGHKRKYVNKQGLVIPKEKSKGHAYSVEIQLINIRHMLDKNDFLNLTVQLCNNNGALTKWHMSDATNWFKRAMPKVNYSALVEVWDGENLCTQWGNDRARRMDAEFSRTGSGKLLTEAIKMEDKSKAMEKYNRSRANMYLLWSKNLIRAARFYEVVRTYDIVY